MRTVAESGRVAWRVMLDKVELSHGSDACVYGAGHTCWHVRTATIRPDLAPRLPRSKLGPRRRA